MFKKIVEKFDSMFGNTLFYPGCMSKYVLVDIESNYRKILQKLGISFIEIEEINCCGSPVLNAGYKEDFENLKAKNLKILKEYGIKKIITNCPGCYHMFKHEYRLNAEHMTVLLYKNLNKIKNTNMRDEVRKISYHDPCHLGRWSNIYDEPRAVLEKAGYTIVEFERTRDKALCCGAGGGMNNNFPEVSERVGKFRMSQCPTDEVVTPCGMCYRQLKNNAQDGIEVLEFSELIVNRL